MSNVPILPHRSPRQTKRTDGRATQVLARREIQTRIGTAAQPIGNPARKTPATKPAGQGDQLHPQRMDGAQPVSGRRTPAN